MGYGPLDDYIEIDSMSQEDLIDLINDLTFIRDNKNMHQTALNTLTHNMIWITTQFEGFHHYPDAPDEVAFLKNDHRHIFHVKVWIEVTHNDRDIEFFIFKRYVESVIKAGQFNHKSCEMISDDLHSTITAKYPMRDIWIEVSEDGENGSFKRYEIVK